MADHGANGNLGIIRAMLGILIAGLSAVVHLMLIGGYTLWSVIVIAVDCLVIYGLATHGFGRARHAVHP